MIGVVLAAGRGTRMQPYTDAVVGITITDFKARALRVWFAPLGRFGFGWISWSYFIEFFFIMHIYLNNILIGAR
mgnify:CR=1 FL=1